MLYVSSKQHVLLSVHAHLEFVRHFYVKFSIQKKVVYVFQIQKSSENVYKIEQLFKKKHYNQLLTD